MKINISYVLFLSACIWVSGVSADMIANYELDENTSNSVVSDRTGNGYDGTLFSDSTAANTSTVYSSDSVASGGSFRLNGTSEHIQLPNLEMGTSYSYSITAWVKRDTSSWNYNETIFSNKRVGRQGENITGFYIQHSTVDDNLKLVWDAMTTNWQPRVSTFDIPEDQWIGVAVTSSQTAVKLYKYDPVTEIMQVESFASVDAVDINYGYIGWDQSQTTRHFPGNIDDVRIYNNTLSDSEIEDVLKFKAKPAFAFVPIPQNGATFANTDVQLSWDAGYAAQSHDVYFGLDYDSVNNASRQPGDIDGSGQGDFDDLVIISWQWLQNPAGVEPYADLDDDGKINMVDFSAMANDWLIIGDPALKGNQLVTGYLLEDLVDGNTYYWRIDQLNGPDIAKGQVWSFTVQGGPVSVPSIFADNMIMQRQTDAPVWGWAEPGQTVTIDASWQGQPYVTTADQNGRWQVQIPTPDAGDTTYSMAVSGSLNTITITDIIMGDVWVLGGQSNMQFRLGLVDNAVTEVPRLSDLDIRPFWLDIRASSDPEEKDVGNGNWGLGTDGAAEWTSAVGMYFAHEIKTEFDVPVGLILASQGGTAIYSWLSEDAMIDNDLSYQANRGVSVDIDPSSLNASAELYYGMVAPLQPYAIKGVLWYQGESDCALSEVPLYRQTFITLIDCWRDGWGQGDFPFLFVQLPNWDHAVPDDGAWSMIREAQLQTWQAVDNTAMAVTIDVGDPVDIHPTNKEPVGQRLALAALKKAYGYDIVYSGPIYNSMTVNGNEIVLEFDHVGSGLVVQGAALQNFTIAGVDDIYYIADAVIVDDTVVVSSNSVSSPTNVRYGWQRNPTPACNLYNQEGLPASPFRTDGFSN